MDLPTRSAVAPTSRRMLRGVVAVVLVAGLGAAAGEFAIWQARVALDNRSQAEAARWLAVAGWLSPRRGEAAFLEARLARRDGRYQDARRRLLAAADAGWPVAQLEREQWIALAQTGQTDAMQEHWDALLMEPGSDLPEICEAFARDSLKRLQVQNARRVLDAWRQDRPEDAGPYTITAQIHASLREWEPAADDYRAALDRDPTDIASRRGLAEALEKLLRFDEALAAWTAVVEAEPTDGQAVVGRCNCLARTGGSDAAREELAGWLADHPKDVAALEAAGRLALVEGDAAAAVTWLTAAASIRPEDAELRYALGRALRLAGREDDAEEHLAYRQAAEEPLARLRALLNDLPGRPQDPEIRAEIGALTYRWKSHDEGLQWSAAALDLDPDNAAARQLLAEHAARSREPSPPTTDNSAP
ncbi:MAG: tetratricopeptide repeat protein [Planctomycetota bacterium]|nr:tetratricopeptide repeat protein [Planctomycetota bacterium]